MTTLQLSSLEAQRLWYGLRSELEDQVADVPALDIPATIAALHKAAVATDKALARDPNPRRILEALCVRHGVAAVFNPRRRP